MSDTGDITPDDERLRYAGATTRHDGDDEPRKTLGEASVDDLIGDDESVLADAEPASRPAIENAADE